MDNFVQIERKKIEGKVYLVPRYDTHNFEQYFLPRLGLKGVQHVYFDQTELLDLYKSKQLDPQHLECDLEKAIPPQNPPPKRQIQQIHHQNKETEVAPAASTTWKRQRPPLRQKGFTHFLQVPLAEVCRQSFENLIRPQIGDDLDALVHVDSLHVTLMVLHTREEDLIRWEKIVRSLKLKKTKVGLRGVGIFPVKPNTNFTQVLYIKVEGLDEVVHDLTSKAIEEGLVKESELSHIAFDKKTDTYRIDQPHMTIMKTKGKVLLDATPYLRSFGKINMGRIPLNQIRMSVLGSFDEDDGYFDEFVVNFDK